MIAVIVQFGMGELCVVPIDVVNDVLHINNRNV